MHKLFVLLLAVVVSLVAVGALAAATSSFPCDFVQVARRHAPECAPKGDRPLLSSVAEGGVKGS